MTRQGLGAWILREKVEKFVAEDGYATGFEPDDGDSGFDFRGEFVEDFLQKGFRALEHSVVVERAAAAEMGFGNGDLEAKGFQDFYGGFGRVGVEVVIEGVGPEEDCCVFKIQWCW